MRIPLTLMLLYGFAAPALAYIGPGLGAGTLAAILGVLASLFLALFAIFWYPLKRLLKKTKGKGKKRDDTDPPEERDKAGQHR